VKDRFGREINYLRVSVTDRCNLRCRYCVGPDGVKLLPRDEILSFEEIVQVVEQAARMGVNKVRLTGGEPLVRRDLYSLVAAISRIEGIADLAMSTNGVLLAQNASDLARSGLMRVNVSLDTVDPERYRYLTRGGEVNRVLEGIEAARSAGLEPVKLNCVTGGPCGDADRLSVEQYAREQGLQLRMIPHMDFASGEFSVVQGGSGGDCRRCNRLRLSSDGRIRPCLFSDLSYSVRELGADQALRLAVAHKPEAGRSCTHDWMHGIGG
jgi:cyclic pyranopterin phosphate synthase